MTQSKIRPVTEGDKGQAVQGDARQLLAKAYLPVCCFPGHKVVKVYPEEIYQSILDHFSDINDLHRHRYRPAS